MPNNIYLKLEGVKGQTQTENFKDQIEILSYSEAVSMPLTANASNQTRATGRPLLNDIHVTKVVDDASTEILSKCLSGDDFKTAVITVTQMDQGKMVPVWIVTMDNVIVSSVNISSGGNDLPVENITFNFSKVKWEFKKQTTEGKKEGTKTSSFDAAAIAAPKK